MRIHACEMLSWSLTIYSSLSTHTGRCSCTVCEHRLLLGRRILSDTATTCLTHLTMPIEYRRWCSRTQNRVYIDGVALLVDRAALLDDGLNLRRRPTAMRCRILLVVWWSFCFVCNGGKYPWNFSEMFKKWVFRRVQFWISTSRR